MNAVRGAVLGFFAAVAYWSILILLARAVG